MTRRWLLLLPPVAQLGALAVWALGWPPSSAIGLQAQWAALFIMLVSYGAFGLQRFRFLRRSYAEIRRKRIEHADAFQAFADEQLRRPQLAKRRPDPITALPAE